MMALNTIKISPFRRVGRPGALPIENKRSVDEIIPDFDAFGKFSQGVPKVRCQALQWSGKGVQTYEYLVLGTRLFL
jgi:hypothetical protein